MRRAGVLAFLLLGTACATVPQDDDLARRARAYGNMWIQGPIPEACLMEVARPTGEQARLTDESGRHDMHQKAAELAGYVALAATQLDHMLTLFDGLKAVNEELRRRGQMTPKEEADERAWEARVQRSRQRVAAEVRRFPSCDFLRTVAPSRAAEEVSRLVAGSP